MSSSIDYATPAFIGRHWRVGAWTPGLLTLHRGLLVFTDHAGETTFDHDLADITVEPSTEGKTRFWLTTAAGGRWHCGFWDRAQYPTSPPRDNPIGVRIEDIDLTDKWSAQDVCETWQRILAAPNVPDPSAWHPDPPSR